MKLNFALITLTLIILGCNTSGKKTTGMNTNKETDSASLKIAQPHTTDALQDEILVGEIQRKELEAQPYGKWFNSNYEDFEIDQEAVKEIGQLMDDIEVTVFMGTWCGDSKRETPKFFKIMDKANVSKNDIYLVAVTRNKNTPNELEKDKNITNVPTFIFYKDGEELGRIVESPVETLEKDMLKILKGEEYKHTYAY